MNIVLGIGLLVGALCFAAHGHPGFGLLFAAAGVAELVLVAEEPKP